jgi:hypothetical protein
MQQFTDVIMQFVNKMGYLRSKDIEGIIFYGSNQTGFGNQFSAISLCFISFSSLISFIFSNFIITTLQSNCLTKMWEIAILWGISRKNML